MRALTDAAELPGGDLEDFEFLRTTRGGSRVSTSRRLLVRLSHGASIGEPGATRLAPP